jgi:RsiW-degrading membrane proteinase PrsW (M82 family)
MPAAALTETPLWLRAAVAFLPVVLFLIALVLLDSFRLVPRRRVAAALAAGSLAALASYVVNSLVLEITGLPVLRFAVYVGPVIEETLKAVHVALLIRTRRVGFMVDAVILGFAAGAGFGIVENLHYLRALPQAPLLVWIIRGLGTAVMHGGATAILALVLMAFGGSGDGGRRPWPAALVAAVVFHAAFNRFMVHPVAATAVMLVVLPALLNAGYRLGEKRLRRWLGYGFDRDSELLALISSGEVRETPLGRYLRSLRENFRPDAVADMLCLIRLQCELNLRAKGTLLLREHGLQPAPDPDLASKLAEVRWLEQAIGQTGLLALRPVCRWRGADEWQRHLLEDEAHA